MQHLQNSTNSKSARQLLQLWESLVVISVKPMKNEAGYTLILVTKGHGIKPARRFERDRLTFVQSWPRRIRLVWAKLMSISRLYRNKHSLLIHVVWWNHYSIPKGMVCRHAVGNALMPNDDKHWIRWERIRCRFIMLCSLCLPHHFPLLSRGKYRRI